MNDDFRFLSQYVAKQFYKILKINLTTNSFEILKNNDIDNKIYQDTANVDELFNKYINGGYVHNDDLNIVKEKLNVKFIRNHFSILNEELDCWYRRRINDTYKWTVVKVIKAPEFTFDNQIVFLIMQDNDVPVRTKINTKILDEYKILKSITKIFVSMQIIDLETDTYIEYKRNKYMEKLPKTGCASTDLKKFVNLFIRAEYKKDALEFVNLDNLTERIRGNSYITYEVMGLNLGWVRLAIFPILDDENDKFTNVIFAISNINEQKCNEENLKKLSYTDGLTGLFNRYSFEIDLRKFEVNLKFGVIISVDVNNLKFFNDTYGHNVGDDLIKRTSLALYNVLAGFGRIYRTGGDEFIALIHYKDDIISLINSINKEINEENKTKEIKLSVSIGYALYKNHTDLSIHDLIEVADKEMYEAKKKFYIENKLFKYRNNRQ